MTVAEVPRTSFPCDSILSLEQAYIKVPFEQGRRCFRNQLKIVDKELASLPGLLSELDLRDTEKREKLLARLQNTLLKYREEASKYRQRFQSRLAEVKHLAAKGGGEGRSDEDFVEISRWYRSRVFRLVAEYLLQKGLCKAANTLIKQHSLQEHVDVELYEESLCVRSSLINGSATECLAWCSENRSLLKKIKSPLEFMLRRQEFIELARRRDLGTCILYARKHFTAFIEGNETEIEQVIALLAIRPCTQTHPYNWLYDKSRWHNIAAQFDLDNQALHGLPERPQLVSLIHAGLATLKTPQCSTESESHNPNINCPVCTPPLAAIASRLPFAHHETSILVCPITGAIMDADNVPMALPNGNVYSLKALEQMAASMSGNITCPRTKQVFRFVEARKCFIS